MSCNLKLPWWQPVNVISLFFWGTPSQRQALFAFILILYSLHWVAESEVFGWSHNRSRIPNNSRSRIQILYPTPDAQLDHFLHHTLKLGIPVEMVQFLMKLLLKQRIQAVYHDFHWLLLATKLFTAKLHSLYVKGSEFLERSKLESESDILPPTPQPWFASWWIKDGGWDTLSSNVGNVFVVLEVWCHCCIIWRQGIKKFMLEKSLHQVAQ